ncbi:Fic family protein [Thiotrichales bacterium 19S3-7]|nr:Fic family protein [Thiotrichales bacterium 19S3-7]MCF6802763.1 Fic family protein [Thiotrichales bacterium 19S3-11]
MPNGLENKLINKNFLLKLMFSDFGRGSYMTLFNEFEKAEAGYYKACLTTYEAMDSEITIENLTIEKIKYFHQMIVLGVKNTNYKDKQELACEFNIDQRKFMIPIYKMSYKFRQYIEKKYPFGRYSCEQQKYYREKLSISDIEEYINKYLDTFKKQYKLAQNEDQKAEAIYEFVQNLEFLHPFFDANMRFFGIALHNTLRKCASLKEIIFVDPNFLDLMLYEEFKLVKPYFEFDNSVSWREDELVLNNIQAINHYEQLTGYSHFFRMLVEKDGQYDDSIKSYLTLFENNPMQLKQIFLSKHLDVNIIGIHHALKVANLKTVALWIHEVTNSSLTQRQKIEVINVQNQYGETLLHVAVQKGFFDIVRELIRSGGDLTIKNDFKQVAAYYAESTQMKELLKRFDDQIPMMPFSDAANDFTLNTKEYDYR